MTLWKVRVYCLTASYILGPYVAGSREDALEAARSDLRRHGNRDMLGWQFSVWRA